MRRTPGRCFGFVSGFALILVGAGGCSAPAIVAGSVFGTIATSSASQSPSDQMKQTYYLGVFDPLNQIEPVLYRVRIRGQASILSTTRFASGWVPADVVDTLKPAELGDDFEVLRFVSADPTFDSTEGRRLRIVGPEGVRQIPRDHRLVIVSGSDSSAFFEAAESAFSQVVLAADAGKRAYRLESAAARDAQLRADQKRLNTLLKKLSTMGGK